MPEEEKKKRITLTKTHIVIGIICGIFVILGGLYGFVDHCVVKFNTYDDTLVHIPEFKAFQFQVNEQTLQNRIDFYQRLVWDLEKKYNSHDHLKMGEEGEKYSTALKELSKAEKQLVAMQTFKSKEEKP